MRNYSRIRKKFLEELWRNYREPPLPVVVLVVVVGIPWRRGPERTEHNHIYVYIHIYMYTYVCLCL